LVLHVLRQVGLEFPPVLLLVVVPVGETQEKTVPGLLRTSNIKFPELPEEPSVRFLEEVRERWLIAHLFRIELQNWRVLRTRTAK